MKKFLSDSEEEEFKRSHYKINTIGLLIFVVIMTLGIQPLFLDTENSDKILPAIILLVTVIGFSLVAFGLIIMVHRSLVGNHLTLDETKLATNKKDETYYIPCEQIGDNYEVNKGIMYIDDQGIEFVGKEDNLINIPYSEIEKADYREVVVKGIGNVVKKVPKRLYLIQHGIEWVFVMPVGDKLFQQINDKING